MEADKIEYADGHDDSRRQMFEIFFRRSKMSNQNIEIEIKNPFHGSSAEVDRAYLLVLPLMVLAHVDFAQAAGAIKFDHIQTGFNLTGAHILTCANPAISRVCSREPPGIVQPVTWRVTAWEQRQSPASISPPPHRATAAIAPQVGYRLHTAMPALHPARA